MVKGTGVVKGIGVENGAEGEREEGTRVEKGAGIEGVEVAKLESGMPDLAISK